MHSVNINKDKTETYCNPIMAEKSNYIFTEEQLFQQKTRTVYEEGRKKYSEMTKNRIFQDKNINAEFTDLKNEPVTMQNLSINCRRVRSLQKN